MESWSAIARSSWRPPTFPEYVFLTRPNGVFDGSTNTQKLHSSSSSCRFASSAVCVVEKKPLLNEMLPTVSASLSCRHMASLRSLVVSQPSVLPAPSCSATHRWTLPFWIACRMCCDSNLRASKTSERNEIGLALARVWIWVVGGAEARTPSCSPDRAPRSRLGGQQSFGTRRCVESPRDASRAHLRRRRGSRLTAHQVAMRVYRAPFVLNVSTPSTCERGDGAASA